MASSTLTRLGFVLAAASFAAGCTGNIDHGGPSGDDDDVADEQFPPELLDPYTGPAINYYDNSFINYRQLKNRVAAVFADDWMRGGVDEFAANMPLFGGADFVDRFTEPRVASTDFLLGLDNLAPDICSTAVAAHTGPFTGIDPTAAVDGAGQAAAMTNIDLVYQRMLYRPATTAEQTDAYALVSDIVALPLPTPSGWSALCEALVRSPDFVFTLAPSISTSTGDAKKKLLLVKVAMDLLARPPTQAEFDEFLTGGKELGAMVDEFLASDEFRDYYFNRIRLRTQSAGEPITDEPARLWVYLATTGAPFSDLFTADYSVDANWTKVTRSAEHAGTGILTMTGFMLGKPGLPHFTFSARVMGDYLGQTFEVPPSIVDMRVGATAASTVDPTSVCFTCHRTLTPLAFQHSRWADDGTYHTTDANGVAIDDSDRGMVDSYRFKGEGMAGFAAHAVKKEAFIRRMLNAQYGLLVGRDMRSSDDERAVYKHLWDLNTSSSGNLKAIIKDIILSPTYQGGV